MITSYLLLKVCPHMELKTNQYLYPEESVTMDFTLKALKSADIVSLSNKTLLPEVIKTNHVM